MHSLKRCLLLTLALMMLLPAARAADYYGVTVKDTDTTVRFPGLTEADPQVILDMLSKHPNINKVELFDAKLSNRQMLDLFYARRDVDFGFTIRWEDHVVRTDATAFSTLHSKYKPTHDTEQISMLRMCRHLEALDFGHNAVDNIDFLYDLPKLKILIIALNRIEDITPVGSLKDLEYLEMFRNRIRDLSPLVGLSKLKDLNIGYNAIRDLSPLMQMPQLERLWMFAYDYVQKDTLSKEFKQQLKTALPNCQFNFTHAPTLEGWREHPRYFVLADIFKTGVYRPFEEGTTDGK